MKQETIGWQWHQLDDMQIICTSLKTDKHASTSLLDCYRPDALPDAQPTPTSGCVNGGYRETQLAGSPG